MKKYLSVFVIIVGALSAYAETNLCLDNADVARILNRFSISTETNPDLCDPEKSYNYKVIKSLLYAEGLDLSGPSTPSPWNQNILPKNWLDYIHQRARNIRGGSQDPYYPEYCARSSPAAYVNSRVPNSMFVCKAAFDPRVGILDLLSIFIHEARHHDREGIGHVTCRRGDLAGTSALACDTDIREKASYAVTVEGYAKLAVSARNIHPTAKKGALAQAISYEKRFNKAFVTNTPWTLLVDSSGRWHSFDGKSLNVVNSQQIPSGALIPRATGEFVLFPDDKNLPAQRFEILKGFKLNAVEDLGTFMTEYAQRDPEKRALVQDILYSYSTDNKFSARLIGNEVLITRTTQDGSEDQVIAQDLGNLVRFFTARDLNASANNRLYVVNEQEYMFRIEILPKKSKVTRIDNPIPGVIAISTLGSEKFALNKDGQLLKKKGDRFVTVPDFQNHRFLRMSRDGDQSSEILSITEASSSSQNTVQ